MTKVRVSDWYSFDVCVNCHSRLSNHIKMHSKGVCPKCGNNSNSTIIDTYKVILQELKHHPWWRFWNKKYTYRGAGELSINWLKKKYNGNTGR
jgi:predicted RNA-binding Zn-ribbon protein involved in translation (DUF1610 family)